MSAGAEDATRFVIVHPSFRMGVIDALLSKKELEGIALDGLAFPFRFQTFNRLGMKGYIYYISKHYVPVVFAQCERYNIHIRKSIAFAIKEIAGVVINKPLIIEIYLDCLDREYFIEDTLRSFMKKEGVFFIIHVVKRVRHDKDYDTVIHEVAFDSYECSALLGDVRNTISATRQVDSHAIFGSFRYLKRKNDVDDSKRKKASSPSIVDKIVIDKVVSPKVHEDSAIIENAPVTEEAPLVEEAPIAEEAPVVEEAFVGDVEEKLLFDENGDTDGCTIDDIEDRLRLYRKIDSLQAHIDGQAKEIEVLQVHADEEAKKIEALQSHIESQTKMAMGTIRLLRSQVKDATLERDQLQEAIDSSHDCQNRTKLSRKLDEKLKEIKALHRQNKRLASLLQLSIKI
jgi:hypothetical protein